MHVAATVIALNELNLTTRAEQTPVRHIDRSPVLQQQTYTHITWSGMI